MHVTFTKIPGGLGGTAQTLHAMARAVRGELPPDHIGYLHESIRNFSTRLCVGILGHDFQAEVMTCFFLSAMA